MTRYLLVFLPFLLILIGPFMSFAMHPRPEVLVLNSYHPGMAWSDNIMEGISDVLEPTCELRYEFMDSKRFVDAAYVEMLSRLYALKYSGDAIDLIIASDDFAFQFLLERQSTLFPGVPVVFCGVSDHKPGMMGNRLIFTGVRQDICLRDCIALITRLLPDVREIVAVTDDTVNGRSNRRELGVIATERKDIRFIFIDENSEVSAEELLRRLSGLKAGTAVYYSEYFRDASGKYLDYKEFLPELSEACKVPIFAAGEYYLGYGIVGGLLFSGREQGREAARLAMRILEGTPPAEIPVVTGTPKRYAFDDRQLRRFGIKTSRLPKGSEIVHSEDARQANRTLLLLLLALSILVESGIIAGLLYAVRRRKQAERELVEREALYRGLFEGGLIGMAISEPKTRRWLEVNDRLCEMCGYSRDELMELGWGAITHPDDLEANNLWHERLISGEIDGFALEKRYFHKNGWIMHVAISVRGLRRDDGSLHRIYTLIHDISDFKNAEEALRASEEKFSRTFKESPIWVVLSVLEDGRYIEVNDSFLAATGYTREEVIGRTALEIAAWGSPAERAEVVELIKKHGSIRNREVQRYARDGTMISMLYSGTRIRIGGEDCLISVSMDITEQKAAEQEKALLESRLRQVQKMEALATLAGGIAHDFNNLLMGIQGHVSLALHESSPGTAVRGHLQSVEEYVRSASELTAQLLGLARGGKYEVRPTDLNALLRRTAEMFGRTRKEIRIHYQFVDALWAAPVDRGQLEQVFLNIMVNASQAMPDGGDLYLVTENVSLVDDYAHVHQLSAGRHIKVSLTDTGCGMDEITRQRVFDPFFTTKGMGRGTGLGLASAYGIVKNHGGVINVYSEPGKGTTFTIYLPVIDAEPERDETVRGRLIRGSETVLLVDDEGIILEVARQMLERLGYNVITASSGEEAVDIFTAGRNGIDLVILDMVMPGLDGGRTFDRLREHNADIKVLLSSGYSMNGQAMKILGRGCNGFIQKPFGLQELSAKLRELLDN